MAQNDEFNRLLRESGVVSVGDPAVRVAQAKLSLGITPSNAEMRRLVDSQFYEQQRMNQALEQGKKDAYIGFNNSPQARLYAQATGTQLTRPRFTADELLAANQPGTVKPEARTPRMPGPGEMVEYGGKQYAGRGYKAPESNAPAINIAGVGFPATAAQRDVMGLDQGQPIPAPTKVPKLISTTPRTADVGPMSQVPVGGYGLPGSTVSTQRRGGGVVVPVTPTQVQPDSPFSPAPYQEKSLNEIMSPFQPAPYQEKSLNEIMSPFNIAPTQQASLQDVMSPFNIAPTQQKTLDEVMSPFSPAPVSQDARLNQAKRYIAESEAMAKRAAPAPQSNYQYPAYSAYGLAERSAPIAEASGKVLSAGSRGIRSVIEGILSGDYSNKKVMFEDAAQQVFGGDTVEQHREKLRKQDFIDRQSYNPNTGGATSGVASAPAGGYTANDLVKLQANLPPYLRVPGGVAPGQPTQAEQPDRGEGQQAPEAAAVTPVAPSKPVTQQQAAQAAQMQRAPAQQQAFTPQQYNPMAAFQGPGSVSETLYGKQARAQAEHQQKMQLDTYKANVNAQSKALRDSFYAANQVMGLNERQSKLVDAELKRQFNANPNLKSTTVALENGDKVTAVQTSQGHWQVQKTPKGQKTGLYRPATYEDGTPIPGFIVDTGSNEIHALDFMAQMAGGATGGTTGGAAGGAKPLSFKTVEEAQAANLKPGTKIIVNGRPATVK